MNRQQPSKSNLDWLAERYRKTQLPSDVQKVRKRMEKIQEEFPVIWIAEGNKEYQQDPEGFVRSLMGDITTLLDYIENGE